jgi:hypothetical protein
LTAVLLGVAALAVAAPMQAEASVHRRVYVAPVCGPTVVVPGPVYAPTYVTHRYSHNVRYYRARTVHSYHGHGHYRHR